MVEECLTIYIFIYIYIYIMSPNDFNVYCVDMVMGQNSGTQTVPQNSWDLWMSNPLFIC